jgi:hypothetical protein
MNEDSKRGDRTPTSDDRRRRTRRRRTITAAVEL